MDGTQRGRDMAAPIRHLTLDGERYTLAFSNQAARVAEDVYEQQYGQDVGYGDILTQLSRGKYKAIMAVLYGALVAGGAQMDWATFDATFRLASVEGVREIIVQGVAASLPQADGQEDSDTP